MIKKIQEVVSDGLFLKKQIIGNNQLPNQLLRVSAESQIEFLQKIQSLFEDSSFSATYKFALLITLANLAIELGNDQEQELTIPSEKIAVRFSELYWPQIKEYSSGREVGVLYQNNGTQAKIISILLDIQNQTGIDSYSDILAHPIWTRRLNSIIATIWNNPVFYLQEDENQFIYTYSNKESLTLTNEAHLCLRKFNEYIIQYAKNGWMTHLKTNAKNQGTLNTDSDLESFLFGASRETLIQLRPLLMNYQNGKCFYCSKNIKTNSKADVDHFIPWKKYSRNLAENLVLSCPSCNRSKSDMLAAKIHLEKWLIEAVNNPQRNNEIHVLGFLSDRECNRRIASWAYQNAAIGSSNGWVTYQQFELINQDYLSFLN
jgi:5-methylcytosine-specific restriction endonuclease McrA